MYDTSKPYKQKIYEAIKSTWDTDVIKIHQTHPYLVYSLNVPYEYKIDHTDGIGTKGYWHWKHRTFMAAAVDALAMNLNDLLTVGAIPYAIQNHLMLPYDDHDAILEIISSLATLCEERKIVLTGGETAIHDNMDGLELSITVSAYIPQLRTNEIKEGDVLVGLPSIGFHSNGFTLLGDLGCLSPEEITKPTMIYWVRPGANCIIHIAGGAYTRLKDYLVGLDAHLEFDSPDRFHEVYKHLYGSHEKKSKIMYRTFNCGYGMIFSLLEEDVNKVLNTHLDSKVIGYVEKGSGKVNIKSAFGNKETIVL